MSASPPQEAVYTQKPSLTFEFTKRKRWADLLIAELADGINLILSPTRKVLYCGSAITELIGWRDSDFIDHDLLDFITDGQAAFCASFEESAQKNSELLSYVRLKCSDNMASHANANKDIPFEITGRPHTVSEHDQDGRCFFAIAKPYPSRNVAMLNTYLELKTENEQLQRRLLGLRTQAPTQDLATTSTLTSQTNPIYATSSLHTQRVLAAPVVPSQGTSDDSNSPYSGTADNVVLNTTGSLFDEEDDEEGAKKKRLKKSHPGELYVCITCGRTDSPEWRKGPLGPKTLCNACGLRWAKQMRRTDDPSEVESGETSST